MASKTSVSSLARRSLNTSHFSVLTIRRAYSHFPPTRRRCLLRQSKHNYFLTSRRPFSTTPWRGLADVDDSFDPLQQDRESDEVDVCIVGGGMSSDMSSVKHAKFLQDPPASAQPFASNRLPMKPETKTFEFCFSRKQASLALTSSPAMSSNRPPSTNCSLIGIIRITLHVSNMLPRLLTIKCGFSPRTALYRSLRLRRCTTRAIILSV